MTTTVDRQPAAPWFGLPVEQSTYTNEGRTTIVLRTDPFVCDVEDTRGNGRLRGKAYLWRTATTESDYATPAAGDVTYHGFMAGGRQALHYGSDAEAARYVRTRRADGQLVPAASDPDWEASARAYDLMMSY